MKTHESSSLKTFFLIASVGLVSNAFAQTPPDAGQLMREIEPRVPLENNVIPQLPEAIQAPTNVDGTSLPVANFNFNGNSILKTAELQQVVASWIDKKLTLPELKHVTDLIAEQYRNKGYLARVFLPEQNIHDGSVSIEVIEARFGQVILESNPKRLVKNPSLIQGLVMSRQKSGGLFNLSDIERASLLINDIPGISAKAVLAASDKEQHTDVKLSVSEEDQHTSYVSFDNYGSRSSGEERLIYSTTLANPLKRGDKLDGTAMLSEGNVYAKVGYELPIGSDGIRAGASLSLLSYSLGGEFDDLDAEGSATNITFTAGYPLIRQTRQNLTVSGKFFLRDYENEQLGVQTSDKSVTAINVGIRGDRVDGYQGGGVFYYGASLTLGDLDLSGNQTNLLLDQFSAKTNGSYNKIDWNIARLQQLNSKTNLWLSIRGQFADKNIDSSETISLGGASGVRAYPSLEASGDEGYIITAEVRYKIRDNWNVKGFYDLGDITQKATESEPSASHSLKGYGASIDWDYPKQMITANFTIARRIGTNPLADPVTGDDSDGSSNDFPVWLNVTKHF